MVKMRIDCVKLVTELTKKHMTQIDLASKAGVSRNTISSIKNGKSCSDVVGIKIAKALGCEVTDLLEDETV